MKKVAISIFLFAFAIISGAQTVDVSLLKKHVFSLASDSLRGRGFGLKGGRLAAKYIERQFAEVGIQPWKGSYRNEFIYSAKMLRAEGCNIVGWVEGNDPQLKNEFIVIGAHYDHVGYTNKNDSLVVYNGADDNASGTAMLIELGRWLVRNKHNLKRSIFLVAFDGEESGLVGSMNLVRQNYIPVENIKVMFSIDMVGMLSTYGGIDLKGNETIQNGDPIFNNLGVKHGIELKKQGKRPELQTDTAPFANKGIPSIHIFTSTVSQYHKPEDDASLLDYEGMGKIANFMTEALITLSAMEEINPNRHFVASVKEKWYAPTFGARVGLGSAIHDYTNEFYEGKEILGVQAGLFLQTKITKIVSIQPELLYRTVGSENVNGTLRTHEVTIPVNLRVKLNPKSSSFISPDLFVFFGPYYSYKFAGKVGGNDLDFENSFKVDEKGIQVGIGIEAMRVQLISMIQYSLTSIDRNSSVIPINYMFCMGFTF